MDAPSKTVYTHRDYSQFTSKFFYCCLYTDYAAQDKFLNLNLPKSKQ
jgi:hypothetical protein